MNEDRDAPLTVDQLAESLRLETSWVYTHARELGGVKFGKYWRFFPAQVEALKRKGIETR